MKQKSELRIIESPIPEGLKNFSPHDICPSEIFRKEQEAWNNPESSSLKRYPNEIGLDLEMTIQNLILRFNKVPMSQWQALIPVLNSDQRPSRKGQPFQSNFFFTDSLANVLNLLSNSWQQNKKQYYCYTYHEYFPVIKEEIFEDQFELLFAFALRQCRLTNVSSFLQFHLKKNFRSEIKEYSTYIKQIKQRFSRILFEQELIELLDNWSKVSNEKIKEDKSSHQIESTRILRSFQLSNPKDEARLPDILNGLRNYEFVFKETSLRNFKNIFRGEEIINPIIWIGNISELHYFIKYIHRTVKKIKPLHQKIWQTTSCCFVDSNGERFPWKAFNGQKKPARASLLETIASNL